jgi:hypothetical protein
MFTAWSSFIQKFGENLIRTGPVRMKASQPRRVRAPARRGAAPPRRRPPSAFEPPGRTPRLLLPQAACTEASLKSVPPFPPSDRTVLDVRAQTGPSTAFPAGRSYRDLDVVPRRLTAPCFEAALPEPFLPLKSGSRLSWRHPCTHHRARSTAVGAPPPHSPPVTRPPPGTLL